MNKIRLSRLLWVMDDDTYNTLLNVTNRHLRLVKESLDLNITGERKKQIQAEINDLRQQRDTIIQEYKNQI